MVTSSAFHLPNNEGGGSARSWSTDLPLLKEQHLGRSLVYSTAGLPGGSYC